MNELLNNFDKLDLCSTYLIPINAPATAKIRVIAKNPGMPNEQSKMERTAPKHAPDARYGTKTPKAMPTADPTSAKK